MTTAIADTAATDIAAWMEAQRVSVGSAGEIVGVAHALAHLGSLVGRIRHETAPGSTVPPVRSVLLYGPPGTGKTVSTRWMVSQLGGIPVYDLPTEQLTPALVRDAFAYLADRPRCVVLLSEVDAIAADRREIDAESRRTLLALLEALDGLATIEPGRGPVVIASTNASIQELDAAATRPGRLGSTKIRFTMPNLAERVELFRRLSAPWTGDPEPDWTHLARLASRMTPAEIRSVIDDALGVALLRDGAGARLLESDLEDATRRGNAVEPEDAAPVDLRRTCVHEAGHTVVALAMGLPVTSVRVELGRRGGRTETGEEGRQLTNSQIWASAVTAMGGVSAETLVLGDASMGAESDVHRASEMLIARIESGLDPMHAPVSRRAWGHGWAPLSLDDRIVPRVVAELAVARAEAERIVEQERDAIVRLADRLAESPVLTGRELARALAEAGLPAGSGK